MYVLTLMCQRRCNYSPVAAQGHRELVNSQPRLNPDFRIPKTVYYILLFPFDIKTSAITPILGKTDQIRLLLTVKKIKTRLIFKTFLSHELTLMS